MLRHNLSFDVPTITPLPKLLTRLSGHWLDDTSITLAHAAGHKGFIRVARTPKVLEISGAIEEPQGWQSLPERHHPEWYFNDHVVIFLDPAHNHTLRRMVAILRTGQIVTEDTTQLVGEEAADIISAPAKAEPLKLSVNVHKASNGWRFRLRIFIEKSNEQTNFTLHPQRVLGLQIKLGLIGPTIHPATTWPPPSPFWGSNAFAFGDVLAPKANITITKVDFGKPVWKTGPISSAIHLTGRILDKTLKQGLCKVEITSTSGDKAHYNYPWHTQGGKLNFSIPADYPFTSKWAPDLNRIARISLQITDPDHHQQWAASWPFGFDAGIIVREPYGALASSKRTPVRPNAGDPDFIEKYRIWLLSKLPNWVWQTTQDGATSDFYLKARRPADNVNLMEPKVMQHLATLIHTRFTDWQDALCATALLLHHPLLTVHSGSWARISGNGDFATILRMGGCFCSETAFLAAHLAEMLGPLYGIKLRGFTLGLRGHLSGLVESPIGEVLIDPMLGIYYHTLDNTRLATLDEMRADSRISERMWSDPRRSGTGAHFFHQVYNQDKKPLRFATLHYPG